MQILKRRRVGDGLRQDGFPGSIPLLSFETCPHRSRQASSKTQFVVRRPISPPRPKTGVPTRTASRQPPSEVRPQTDPRSASAQAEIHRERSEEHTSELQSLAYLVC